MESEEELPVSPVYGKNKKKTVKIENRRNQVTMKEIRKRQKEGKLKKIAKTAKGNHMIHGIDTNVWSDLVFREVIGSLRAWQKANPATLPKVFPQELVHPSQWLVYAKT